MIEVPVVTLRADVDSLRDLVGAQIGSNDVCVCVAVCMCFVLVSFLWRAPGDALLSAAL